MNSANTRHIVTAMHPKVIAFALICLLLSSCAPSIHDATARGRIESVKLLLEQSPALVDDRDGKLKTPLHKAVTYKQHEIMELLVAHGADMNSTDITGMTPLHVAAMLGRRDEAAWLLAHGADPGIEDHYGDTPLHTAVIFGHGQIVGMLVKHGISPDAPNGNDETPAALAVAYRQERVAQYLDHLLRRRDTTSDQ